jgi:hypothetical protein
MPTTHSLSSRPTNLHTYKVQPIRHPFFSGHPCCKSMGSRQSTQLPYDDSDDDFFQVQQQVFFGQPRQPRHPPQQQDFPGESQSAWNRARRTTRAAALRAASDTAQTVRCRAETVRNWAGSAAERADEWSGHGWSSDSPSPPTPPTFRGRFLHEVAPGRRYVRGAGLRGVQAGAQGVRRGAQWSRDTAARVAQRTEGANWG